MLALPSCLVSAIRFVFKDSSFYDDDDDENVLCVFLIAFMGTGESKLDNSGVESSWS